MQYYSIAEGVTGGFTARSGRQEESHRGKPSVSGGESERQVPLSTDKRMVNNGNWLFAGEGALYNASPSPQIEICTVLQRTVVPYADLLTKIIWGSSELYNSYVIIAQEAISEYCRTQSFTFIQPIRIWLALYPGFRTTETFIKKQNWTRTIAAKNPNKMGFVYSFCGIYPLETNRITLRCSPSLHNFKFTLSSSIYSFNYIKKEVLNIKYLLAISNR